MQKHQPADRNGGDGARLHVDAIDDDWWTWRYVEPEIGLELHSNETFDSRDGAVDSARRAYPDVPFAGEEA